MTRKGKLRIIVWSVLILVGAASAVDPAVRGEGILQARVQPFQTEGRVPLTRVLTEVGYRTGPTPVVFGIELDLRTSDEPLVSLAITEVTPLKVVLDSVFAQVPDYAYEPGTKHLIHVHPKEWKPDLQNPLDIAVKRFEVTAVASNVLTRPEEYIDELAPYRKVPSGGSVLSSMGREVHVRVENTTVRGVLNAVCEGNIRASISGHTLFGWIYSVRTSETGELTHVWSAHWSGSPSWKSGD
jgi:hypothetical protein